MNNKVRKGARIEILRQIREGKDVLFGRFSKSLTKQMKNEKWREVHNKAQALGLVPYEKDYTYTRDTLWQNIRKNSMKKYDNARTTGTGGGPEFKLTETDILVSEIIGKDSEVMTGLPVSDTWGNTSSDITTDHEDVDDPEATTNQNPVERSENIRNITTNQIPVERSENIRNIKKKMTKKEEEEELKLKKLKLTLEIMEMEKYERALNILRLERELTLPPSKYTQNIPIAQNCHVIIVDNENLENEIEESSLNTE